MIRLLAIVIVALLVLPASTITLAAPSAQSAGITITGKVEHGADKSKIMADTPVDLYVYSGASGMLAEQVSSTTDANGAFKLEWTPKTGDERYQVIARYQGVGYASGAITGSASDVVMTVYETTHDLSSVKFSLLALITAVDRDSQNLLFIESVVLRNDSDRTYVPAASSTPGEMPRNLLRFSLPPGTAELTPLDGITSDQIITVDTGFAALIPVFPGEQQLSFSYRVPYEQSSLVFSLGLSVPADSVRVLVPEGVATLKSSDLVQQATIERSGRTYQHFAGQNLPANSRFSVEIADLPLLPTAYDPALIQIVGAVIAVVALGALGVYVLRRRSAASAPASKPSSLESLRQELLAELSRIDEQHATGELDDDEYDEVRSAIKDELIGVMRQLRAEGRA